MTVKQKKLFHILENLELIFASGPKGISVNLCGQFTVRKNHLEDDQLDVGDGTHHVHVNWSRVKRFESGTFHGEGMLTFFDGEEILFKFYHPSGPFPRELGELSKTLID